ncbi:hypothetical protein D3C85_1009240 [compost metagenome]
MIADTASTARGFGFNVGLMIGCSAWLIPMLLRYSSKIADDITSILTSCLLITLFTCCAQAVYKLLILLYMHPEYELHAPIIDKTRTQ